MGYECESRGDTLLGIIKNNKLVGLYHSKKNCPNLHKKLLESHGEIHHINRNIARDNPYYCRFCIYIEAEELGIDCKKICPQRICEKFPPIPLTTKVISILGGIL